MEKKYWALETYRKSQKRLLLAEFLLEKQFLCLFAWFIRLQQTKMFWFRYTEIFFWYFFPSTLSIVLEIIEMNRRLIFHGYFRSLAFRKLPSSWKHSNMYTFVPFHFSFFSLLELVCYKKQQKKSQPRNRFGEYGTSRACEWYQIDPKMLI